MRKEEKIKSQMSASGTFFLSTARNSCFKKEHHKRTQPKDGTMGNSSERAVVVRPHVSGLALPDIGCTDQIRRAWAEGGANTLALARIVRSARRNLRRGEWSHLWESGDLPFSR